MSRFYFCLIVLIFLSCLKESFCKKKHKHHSHEHHKHKHHKHHKHNHWYTNPRPSMPTPFYTSTPVPSTDSHNFDPLNYLRRNNFNLASQSKQPEVIQALGYLPREKDETRNMIKLYQKLYNLKVTGELNEETLKKMESPGCANPDIEFSINRKKRSSDWLQSKWTKKKLTYKILSIDKSLKEYTNIAIRKAFDYWQEATDFIFIEIKNLFIQADLEIDFTDREHGDGFPFNQAGEELAHAFFPQDGRIHFFNQRHFTENSTDGYNLRIVATHEIGHALGLEHSFDPTSIMYKYYPGFISNFDLPEKDKKKIKQLYDEKEFETTTPTITTTTTSIIPTTSTSNQEEENNNEILKQILTRLDNLEKKYSDLVIQMSLIKLITENIPQISPSFNFLDGFINKIIQGKIESDYYESGSALNMKETIHFGLTFKEIPTVLLETESLDFVVQPVRLNLKVSNVGFNSFDIEIGSWYTSKIHQITVKWTAIGQIRIV